ncbi:MAG: hypothetical protein OM95_09180 [Bdellovibrio sp. ArHS]|uniref:hypothetical protein n=1 Tax=Bdellovibrio sp. ArHS TaxID=1569284 RepID=UPI000583BD97|nr:hypothetical protein [Bdellovibrio sp. ArHS]KHD88438.1 MAG: hypothetical protein OM95_09180 [Bdellovibrio sp. ArHS]
MLLYQALGWSVLGDSVNFLCLLFVIHGFAAKKFLHILENAVLVTLGYILPLLIRNSLKLSYSEAPSMKDFLHLGLVSTGTTLAFGVVFSSLGYALRWARHKILRASRGKITTRALQDD